MDVLGGWVEISYEQEHALSMLSCLVLYSDLVDPGAETRGLSCLTKKVDGRESGFVSSAVTRSGPRQIQ